MVSEPGVGFRRMYHEDDARGAAGDGEGDGDRRGGGWASSGSRVVREDEGGADGTLGVLWARCGSSSSSRIVK